MPRVLIVDDSPTTRQLLRGIFGSEPDIEIAGEAANGVEAARLTKELRPDVITMDIHMPRMNGLEATQQIMADNPTPIVIVSASTLVNDVQWALKALQAGALTLLLKPPGPTSPDHSRCAKELVETVKAMAGVKVVGRRSARSRQDTVGARSDLPDPHHPTPKPVVPKSASDRLGKTGQPIVAIAASTGGPPAIREVLGSLSENVVAPILIVQHIAAGFTEGFVAWLDASISRRVKVAEQHEALAPSTVYVAPEGFHLGLSRGHRIALTAGDPINGFCPSGSYLFQSVSQAFGPNAIGVILTGMGEDGVSGLTELRRCGGHVIAQDESTSIIFGMPGAAVRRGLPHAVLPLEKISGAIERRLRNHATPRSADPIRAKRNP